MFAVVVVPLKGQRKQYLMADGGLSYSKRQAVSLTRDVASIQQSTLTKQLGSRIKEVLVQPTESLSNKTRNKFGAVQCYWHEASKTIVRSEPIGDFIRFDSKLEANVYQALRRKFSKDEVKLQYKLRIKAETRNYPALFWRVDFFVEVGACRYYVEAKGVPLPEFKRTLQYLEFFDRNAWEKVYIVRDSAMQIDAKKVALSLADFVQKMNNNAL